MNVEDQIDSTIASLKIISMVPKNGRISVRRGQLTLETNDHFQQVRRWLNRDSRDLMIMHVKNTINSAIRLSMGLMENSIETELRAWSMQCLLVEMQNCQTGITNLKTTYNTDSAMVCNLDVINDRLQAHCKRVGDRQNQTNIGILIPSPMGQETPQSAESTKGGEARITKDSIKHSNRS